MQKISPAKVILFMLYFVTNTTSKIPLKEMPSILIPFKTELCIFGQLQVKRRFEAGVSLRTCCDHYQPFVIIVRVNRCPCHWNPIPLMYMTGGVK